MKIRKAKSLLAISTAILLSMTGCGKENTTPISNEINDILVNDTVKDLVTSEVEKMNDVNKKEIKTIPYSEEDFVLQIYDMLEKYDMTYQELLELVLNTPEYNQDLQNILNINSNLNTDKLIAILQGKHTNLRENLYIGDSRTLGMLVSEVINEDNSIYGAGYGYDWLIGEGEFSTSNTNASNGAINGLKDKMIDNEYYNIIIWLGVNDYDCVSANIYFEKYKDLAKNDWSNHNIYIVSVAPVKDSVAIYANNAGINDFNNSLKDLVANSPLNNLYYIDLNLNENSINHYDDMGLHYGASDYENIFNIITKTTNSTDINDIKSILSIFYNALNDYDETFNSYYASEDITQRR